MNVHQFLTSYSYGDAIGNEALEIRDFLRAQGIGSEIFTMHFHPRYANQVRNYLDYDRFAGPGNTVIYHFSIGSPVTKKFLRLADRKIIIYHNITPYQFFLDYHRILAKDCFKGRLELKSLADQVDLALGDSEYNRRELVEAGFRRTGVLPLVMDFSKFDLPVLPVFRELFADGKTNLLYVGRIIPNKKIEDVIRVFHLYPEPFQPRFPPVHRRRIPRLRALRLPPCRAWSASCGMQERPFQRPYPAGRGGLLLQAVAPLPAPERARGLLRPGARRASTCGIPVVAFDAGAVAETMNGGGMLVREKDLLRIAALCHEILTRPALKAAILAGQERGAGEIPPPAHRQDPARLSAAPAVRSHERPEGPPRAGPSSSATARSASRAGTAASSN